MLRGKLPSLKDKQLGKVLTNEELKKVIKEVNKVEIKTKKSK